jgi:hemerythrin
MPLIVWNETMSVGVKDLDEQHKKLVDILNELHESIAAEQSKEVLGKIIEKLIEYTRVHLGYEERILFQAEYPELSEHGRQHDEMIATALAAQAKVRWGASPGLSLEILEFLQNWLINHIQGSDKLYTAHLHAHGIS